MLGTPHHGGMDFKLPEFITLGRALVLVTIVVLVVMIYTGKLSLSMGNKSGMRMFPKSRLDGQSGGSTDPLVQEYQSRMNTNAMRVLQGQANLSSPDKGYNIGSDAPDADSAAALIAYQNRGRLVNMNGTPCRVAASNNFPAGATCGPWTDAATSDAMGIMALQAYNVPSGPESGLETVMRYAADAVNPPCIGAADVPTASGFAVGQTYGNARRMY